MSSMARRARVVIPQLPHHVVHRGNHRQQVFFCDEDRLEYLRILSDSLPKYGVRIISYCLMKNHVHLITVPQRENSLAGLFRRALMLYSRYVNERHGWIGHLWQGRYFSSPLDPPYLYNAVRYVERNPVRAGLVEKPWEYRWSSALFRLTARRNSNILQRYSPLEDMVTDWRSYLELELPDITLGRLRRSTKAGTPMGSEEFLQRLEQAGIEFSRGKRGRTPDWM